MVDVPEELDDEPVAAPGSKEGPAKPLNAAQRRRLKQRASATAAASAQDGEPGADEAEFAAKRAPEPVGDAPEPAKADKPKKKKKKEQQAQEDA